MQWRECCRLVIFEMITLDIPYRKESLENRNILEEIGKQHHISAYYTFL